MSKIPADVMDEAVSVYAFLRCPTPEDIETIARAILAERERCAARAEGKEKAAGRAWVPGSLWDRIRREVAEDIRRGEA